MAHTAASNGVLASSATLESDGVALDASAETVRPIPLQPTSTAPASDRGQADSAELDAAQDPLRWPVSQKWIVTAALSATGFNRIMVSTILAPALPTVAAQLALGPVQAVMALSIYVLATAFSPLLVGPLSEVYGRAAPLHLSNLWFLGFNIGCALAPTGAALLVCRFGAGLGAGAIYPLAAGVLGDLWPAGQRGTSLAVYILFPLLGAAVGPIVGGFVEQYTSWRWIFYSTSALQAVSIGVCFLCYRETHLPTILKRERQRQLRRSVPASPRPSWASRIRAGLTDAQTARLVRQSLTTPLRQLAQHRSVQIQAALSALGYGLLYLVLSTYSSLFTGQYHQSVAISGLHYLAPCLGEVLGSQLGGRGMDAISRRLKRRAPDERFDPAFHLPILVPASVAAGAGLLLYGWAAQVRLHWAVVDVGAVLLLCAMQPVGQALQAYNMDTYPTTRASTTAAVQMFRSLGAFALPLAGPAMYAKLGYGWSNVLVAGVYVGGNLTATWFLWKRGTALLSSSR